MTVALTRMNEISTVRSFAGHVMGRLGGFSGLRNGLVASAYPELSVTRQGNKSRVS